VGPQLAPDVPQVALCGKPPPLHLREAICGVEEPPLSLAAGWQLGAAPGAGLLVQVQSAGCLPRPLPPFLHLRAAQPPDGMAAALAAR
jgi:hypothetical protein